MFKFNFVDDEQVEEPEEKIDSVACAGVSESMTTAKAEGTGIREISVVDLAGSTMNLAFNFKLMKSVKFDKPEVSLTLSRQSFRTRRWKYRYLDRPAAR